MILIPTIALSAESAECRPGIESYISTISKETPTEDIIDKIHDFFDQLSGYDTIHWKLAWHKSQDIAKLCKFLDESGLKETQSGRSKLIIINGFGYFKQSNLYQYFDRLHGTLIQEIEKSKEDKDTLSKLKKKLVDRFQAAVNQRRVLHDGMIPSLKPRNNPYASDESEDNAIKYYLDMFAGLNGNIVIDIRQSLARTFVHARLSNCLAAVRDRLARLIAPAFLSYDWAISADSVTGEIRSSTGVPMIVDALDVLGGKSTDAKSVKLHVGITDHYGLKRAHMASIAPTGDPRSSTQSMITFTGTNHLFAWWTDLCAWEHEVTYFKGKDLEVTVKVHSGIYHMFEKLWPQLRKSSVESTAIVVGGHSLGAALAHLFVLKLIERRYLNVNVHRLFTIRVSTFACPAIFRFDDDTTRLKFNDSFTRAFNARTHDDEELNHLKIEGLHDIITNFNNVNDVVVWGPTYLGFESIGKDTVFNKKLNGVFGGLISDHTIAYRWLRHIDFANHYFQASVDSREWSLANCMRGIISWEFVMGLVLFLWLIRVLVRAVMYVCGILVRCTTFLFK